jgi:hypothetical protein
MAPRPSITPSGVPSSGAKYVVVAIALLAIIGAAVAWRMCQKPPPPTVVVVDAAPPPTTSGRNPEDDIPLPPPVEDAGPDAGKKITYIPGTPSQCDAHTCKGQSGSELESALQFRVKQSHRCYDNALAQDPTLRGKMTVSVRVGANGQVCSASVSNNELGSSSVAQCVTGYFRGANFPAPRGGCADINIPINFVPRQ